MCQKRERDTRVTWMEGRVFYSWQLKVNTIQRVCVCVCVCLSDGEGFGDYFITRDLQLLHPEEPGDT